jgi:PAS domain-containing protein
VLARAVEDGVAFEFEHRLVRPDGAIRILRCVGSTERGRNGRPVRMVGTTEDITPEGS